MPIVFSVVLVLSRTVLNDLKVKEYLMSNLQILEEVVMEMVSQEQLERWLIRKTQSQCTYSSDGSDDESEESLCVSVCLSLSVCVCVSLSLFLRVGGGGRGRFKS